MFDKFVSVIRHAVLKIAIRFHALTAADKTARLLARNGDTVRAANMVADAMYASIFRHSSFMESRYPVFWTMRQTAAELLAQDDPHPVSKLTGVASDYLRSI